ncbi:hypothetical protein COR50_11340 [Chitinophaga caeni]|uniref:Uncharacterized protein n=1 Tax=Chitinophaga caeni TaxID=2029983 RepID=A0A291QV00_9BACT|nr:hypothetical protein [Chitinophaga caeni]ATL47712.1 hypothetical protein COR50_11340 [Chitinophaga caeni]
MSKLVPTICLLAVLVAFSVSDPPSLQHSFGIKDEVVPVILASEKSSAGKCWFISFELNPDFNPTPDRLYNDHHQYIMQLQEDGIILANGTTNPGDEWNSFLLMKHLDSLEVINILEADVAISSGKLSYQVKAWYPSQPVAYK